MASSFTTRIRLEKQGDGENANTWGTRLNQNVIDMVDEAVAGYESVEVSGQASITLTANNGTADQSRNFALRFTGDLAAPCTVVAPNAEKVYFISNETSGGHAIVIKAGSAKTTVNEGSPALIATDGTNISKIAAEFESGTRMAFAQAAAPTGWTAETCATYDNSSLRIITASTSGTGGGTGGSTSFNNAFNSSITVTVAGGTVNATLTGSVSATVLTTAQIPAHRHLMFANTTVGNSGGQATASTQVPVERGGAGASSEDHKYAMGTTGVEATLGRTSSIGSGSSHTHSLAGKGSHNHEVSIASAFNLNAKYVNFIVCTKD
jgi:hypothetical protein